MCSPIGHGLAALAVGVSQSDSKLGWKFTSFCIFSGIAADLDFLVGWVLGDINAYHHLGSHSIVAAFIYGFVIFLIVKWVIPSRESPMGTGAFKWAVIGGTIYLSHSLLDMFSFDGTVPVGMQLFWPFSTEFYIASSTPFRSFLHDTVGSDMWGMITGLFNKHNLITVSLETAIILPLLLLALWNRSHSSKRSRQ